MQGEFKKRKYSKKKSNVSVEFTGPITVKEMENVAEKLKEELSGNAQYVGQLNNKFIEAPYPPDCEYCHTGPVHTFDCQRPVESEYATHRKEYKKAVFYEAIRWLFILIAMLLLGSVFIYVKTQCHMVVVYVEEHSISYMTGRAPMHAVVPAGDQEVLECK